MMKFETLFVFILVFGLMISLSSCQKKDDARNTHQMPSFSDTLRAIIHPISPDVHLLNPYSSTIVHDQYLLINDILDEDYIKIFPLDNFSAAFAWGVQGRGPGEFTFTPRDIGVTEDGIFIFDPMLSDLKFFSIGKTSLEHQSSKSLTYDSIFQPLNRINRLNKELYIADYGADLTVSDEDKNFEHIALQPDNNSPLFKFGEYPESELEEFEKYARYIKTNTSKPDGSAFATAYISAENRIKIYDNSGNLKKDIHVSDPEINPDQNGILFRASMGATNNYIYFLGIYELSEKVYDGEADSNFKTSIEIWTWDGIPIYRAYFDHLINGFSVSEKKGSVYGFSSASETEIYEYRLPDVVYNYR